ncbi:MAG: hypothetical protein RQ724_00080 [Desulfuromonadales bacterium]|nr:hypothetical protein [Desulfuromonadales bacterium]
MFGDIVDREMRLNDAGEMVQMVWAEMPANYPGVNIDQIVIMPNHIHGIIVIVGAAPCGRPDLGQPQGVAPTVRCAVD